MGNCHPSKTNVNLCFAWVDIGFFGVTTSRAVNIYILSSLNFYRIPILMFLVLWFVVMDDLDLAVMFSISVKYIHKVRWGKNVSPYNINLYMFV